MSDTGIAVTGTNVLQFVGGQIAKSFGGPLGFAASSLLLGEVGLVASVTDLIAKIENGTATGSEVANVLQDVASVLAGIGVLAGVANPWVLTAVGIAGLVN